MKDIKEKQQASILKLQEEMDSDAESPFALGLVAPCKGKEDKKGTESHEKDGAPKEPPSGFQKPAGAELN